MESSECNSNISQEFLSKALGDGLEIDSFNVKYGTKPGDNFMSVIYSVEVNAKDKKSNMVTLHLFIKCYPTHPGRQEFSKKSNMFFREKEIYRLWMPELRRFQTEVVGLEEAIALPFAPYVYGECIDFSSATGNEYSGKVLDSLENFIIMDDLRKSQGFLMPNRRECLDIDHMRLVIHELAKIHSISWAYKSRVETEVCSKFPCLRKSFSSGSKSMWKGLATGNVTQAVAILDEALGRGNALSIAMDGLKMNIDSIFDVFLNFENHATLGSLLRIKQDHKFGKDSENPDSWHVICHGDCWSNNMLFRYDETTGNPVELVLVDWQICRETSLMSDLVYVIYVCTDVALRKNYLKELMELYYNTFNDFCHTLKTETLPGFTYDAFEYRFHLYKLIGLALAVIDFPIMLKENEEAQALDLENMERSKDMMDIMADVCRSTGGNAAYKNRLIELVQELYDEGVI